MSDKPVKLPVLGAIKKKTASRDWLEKTLASRYTLPKDLEKSKLTVPVVVKQIKTQKITAKFVTEVKNLILSDDQSVLFIKQDGFEELLPLVDTVDFGDKADLIRNALIELMWSVAGNPSVAEHFLNPNNGQLLQRIMWWGRPAFGPMKAAVYNFFAVFPFLFSKRYGATQAYWLINQTVDAYKYKYGEKNRLEHVVYGLQHETDPKAVEALLAFSVMMTNLPESLADRMSMRSEFRGLGIEKAINRILDDPGLSTPDVESLTKCWQQDAVGDEEDYKDVVSDNTKVKDVDDREAYYDTIVANIEDAKYLHGHFDEVMKSIILLPTDANIGYQKWLLLERVLRQLGGEESQLTFDNREYFSVQELLQKTESEAKETVDHQKLLEEKTKQEAELFGLRSKMKDAEETAISLEKISRLAKDAASGVAGTDVDDQTGGFGTPDDLRKAKDETKAFEKEFGGN